MPCAMFITKEDWYAATSSRAACKAAKIPRVIPATRLKIDLAPVIIF